MNAAKPLEARYHLSNLRKAGKNNKTHFAYSY